MRQKEGPIGGNFIKEILPEFKKQKITGRRVSSIVVMHLALNQGSRVRFPGDPLSSIYLKDFALYPNQ
jgi:hypothetical protein